MALASCFGCKADFKPFWTIPSERVVDGLSCPEAVVSASSTSSGEYRLLVVSDISFDLLEPTIPSTKIICVSSSFIDKLVGGSCVPFRRFNGLASSAIFCSVWSLEDAVSLRDDLLRDLLIGGWKACAGISDA